MKGSVLACKWMIAVHAYYPTEVTRLIGQKRRYFCTHPTVFRSKDTTEKQVLCRSLILSL